jgi:hypothetical protein
LWRFRRSGIAAAGVLGDGLALLLEDGDTDREGDEDAEDDGLTDALGLIEDEGLPGDGDADDDGL